MTILKRLSDGFWSYVSPQKGNATLPPERRTEATVKRPARPKSDAQVRFPSRNGLSMSLVDSTSPLRTSPSWSHASSPTVGNKRRGSHSLTSSAGRRRKIRKMDVDMQYEVDSEVDRNTFMDEEGDQDDSSVVRCSSPGIRSTRSASRGLSSDDSINVDSSLVVSERDDTPNKRKIATLPEEISARGVSTEELRGLGWDDDYITLIQKIAMRGHEPLLPAYMKFEYRFLPDGLFESGHEAFIASVRGKQFRASKALEHLFELGGRVRDDATTQSQVRPELRVRRHFKTYMDWAFDDAGIDRRTRIPILAIECRPAGYDAAQLRANATMKCRKLQQRYTEALRVEHSVEISPASRSSSGTVLSYTLPTFYAVMASHTVVAIMAYDPHCPQPECTSMAIFKFNDPNYDVWNSFALAILVCHVRNVQMRIAEETGLGARQPGHGDDDMEVDDPDA